jgi:hypothetical protein
MFDRLPIEIVCEILKLAARNNYFSLKRVNRRMYDCISSTQYDFIRDHLMILKCDFDLSINYGELASYMLKRLLGPNERIYLYHVYLSISISMVVTGADWKRPKSGDCYIWIGRREKLQLRIKYTRYIGQGTTQHSLKFVWPELIKYRPHHSQMLAFMKKYLPELYGFIVTEHMIADLSRAGGAS